MKTVKGPGIFLSQFIATQPPFNSLAGLAEWAAGLGYRALQIPCHQPAIFDLKQAAVSQTYCDEVRGTLAGFGLEISELSTHLEGQLVAVNPAYDLAFDNFAPAALRGDPARRTDWAIATLKRAAAASENSACAHMPPFPARSPGPGSIPGRHTMKPCLMRRLLSWRAAGCRCWIVLTITVWISAMKYIPAKTCMTVSRLSAFCQR